MARKNQSQSADLRYAYSVGRIRAVETKLLDKSKIDRMIDAKSGSDALKVLTDADYGYSASDTVSVYDYEKLLAEEQKKTYKLLCDIAPYPEIFDLFLDKNDFHNAKVILKSEFLGQDYSDLLVDTGKIPPSNLSAMIKDRNMKDMTAIMRSAVEECIDVFNRTADPQAIDLILDKATYLQMKQKALGSKIKFLTDICEMLIDLVNIKIFLRTKKLEKSWDFLAKALVSGGSISHKIFAENLEQSYENFTSVLKYTPYGQVLEAGIDQFRNKGSLTLFEKLSDNYTLDFVKRGKYTAFGIEPLIGYLMAKENEIKTARIVMVGKINNISNEIIRERLREAYV